MGRAGRGARAGHVQGGVRAASGSPELALELIHAGRWGTTVAGRRGRPGTRAGGRAGRDRRSWPRLADAVLLADLPGRARGRPARARRPRGAGPRHRRPDGRASRRWPGSCATATCAAATRARSPACCAGSCCAAPSASRARPSALDEETGAQLARARRRRQQRARAAARTTRSPRAVARALRRVADGDRLPGTLAGRATRLLHDAGELDAASRGRPCPARSRPARRPSAARAGSRASSARQRPRARPRPDLLRILDDWIAAVGPDAFTNVLPLLRRAFSRPAGGRAPAARRAAPRGGREGAGRRSRRLGSGARATGAGPTTPARSLDVSDERLRRWRLCSAATTPTAPSVRLERAGPRRGRRARRRLRVGRQGGLGGPRARPSRAGSASSVRTSRSGVVRVVQQDAIDRLGLHQLLLEPEVLDNVTPDVHLAATLMSLQRRAARRPAATVARRIVRQVVEDIERRLADRTRSAARGALDRSARTTPAAAARDRLGPHDPGQPQALPARVPDGRSRSGSSATRGGAGRSRRRSSSRSTRAGAWRVERRPRGRARRRAGLDPVAARRSVIAFDTRVVDLTEQLDDPVERAVRHPARRRHGHRPGARLLPDARAATPRRPCWS